MRLPEQVAGAVKEATRGQERRQQDRALFEAPRAETLRLMGDHVQAADLMARLAPLLARSPPR